MAKQKPEEKRAVLGIASRSASTSLIRRLRINDPQAWQRLLDLYGPLVFSWCRRAGLTGEDSADVVQEIFSAVFRGIGAFRYMQPDDTFRGWLRTIARNKIRDHFRTRARRPVAAGGTAAQERLMELMAENPEIEIGTSQLSGLAHRALQVIRSEFEPRTWQAFWLTLIEEQSSSDVAQYLGISTGAVRQAKYRVLRRLRQELGDVE